MTHVLVGSTVFVSRFHQHQLLYFCFSVKTAKLKICFSMLNSVHCNEWFVKTEFKICFSMLNSVHLSYNVTMINPFYASFVLRMRSE